MQRARTFGIGILAMCSFMIGGVPAWGQESAPPPRADGGTVRNVGAILIPIGGSQQVSMTTKKAITNVFLSGEGVAQVSPSPDARAVVVRGITAGNVRLELTDTDGKKEIYDITVQLDVAYLKGMIRRAVPTSNVDAIPTVNRTVILTGWVEKAEHVDTILRVAASVIGTGTGSIINAMQVGGVMQVQLDVTVASVSRSEARRRGFNFLVNGATFQFASILNGLSTSQNNQGIGLGGGLTAVTPQANMLIGVVPWNFLGLLQALRDEQVAKVLAEPKVVTLSGRPARFLSGGQQAVVGGAAGINGPGVDYKDVGTEVDVLPIVLGNGRILLEVQPKFRGRNDAKGIIFQGELVPGFDEQSVRTTIELEPGQTMAIGGLIQTTVQSSAHRVPVLGDLPYVGFFFSSITHSEEEQELVILVTPHLVDAMDCAQAPKRLPGRETRSADDYELFLEGIMEAPRGQRVVFENGKYKAAYKNDPTYKNIPCADPLPKENRNSRGCGTNGCGTGDSAKAPSVLPPAMNKAPAATTIIEGEIQRIKPEGEREVLPPPIPSTTGRGPVVPPIMPLPPSSDDR